MISMFSGASDVQIVNSTFNIQAYYSESSLEGRQGWDRLLEKTSTAALYDSAERFDRPKCHANTRVAIMDQLMSWVTNTVHPEHSLMWLYGPAGAGKSAIAYTLAERCAAEGYLLATFIFRRTISSCNTWKYLIPTIACQMGITFPETRPLLEKIVDGNPMVLDQSMETQIIELILNPLLHLSNSGIALHSKPFLVIIDGLDECEGDDVQSRIVKLTADLASHPQLPLQVLIASRPELSLKTAFSLPSASHILSTVALDDGYQTDHDICLFLHDSLVSIREHHPWRRYIPNEWPTSDVLQELARKSSGQFIYASTVVRYVQSPRHRPTDRLEEIRGLKPLSDNRDLPFVQIDSIYAHLLSTAPDIKLTLDILACFLFADLRRLGHIDHMLQRALGDTRICLSHLASVVDVREHCYTARFHHLSGYDSEGDDIMDDTMDDTWLEEARSVYCPLYLSVVAGNVDHPRMDIKHASLRDFLVDKRRSKDFFLDRAEYLDKFIRISLSHCTHCLAPATDMPLDVMLGDPAITSLSPALEKQLWEFSIPAYWDQCDWEEMDGDMDFAEERATTIHLLFRFLNRVNAIEVYRHHVEACTVQLVSVLKRIHFNPFVILSLLWLTVSGVIDDVDFFDAHDDGVAACWAVEMAETNSAETKIARNDDMSRAAFILYRSDLPISIWKNSIERVVTSGQLALQSKHHALTSFHIIKHIVRAEKRYSECEWDSSKILSALLSRASRSTELGKLIEKVLSDPTTCDYFDHTTARAMERFVEDGKRNQDWDSTPISYDTSAVETSAKTRRR